MMTPMMTPMSMVREDPFLWCIVVPLLVFTVWSELWPRTVSRCNSNAWSSKLRYNVGVAGFEFQGVLYNVFHTTALCRVSHLTLFLDAWAWLSYVKRYHVLMGAEWLCVALLVMQSATFGHRRLTLAFGVFLSVLVYSVADSAVSLTTLTVVVVVTASIRVVGHAAGEIAPPLIFDLDTPNAASAAVATAAVTVTKPTESSSTATTVRRDEDLPSGRGGPRRFEFRHDEGPSGSVFVRYGCSSLHGAFIFLWGPLIGLISELQAGMPYRLLHFAFYTYTRPFLAEPRQWGTSWAKINDAKDVVLRSGWLGWEGTRELYAPSKQQ